MGEIVFQSFSILIVSTNGADKFADIVSSLPLKWLSLYVCVCKAFKQDKKNQKNVKNEPKRDGDDIAALLACRVEELITYRKSFQNLRFLSSIYFCSSFSIILGDILIRKCEIAFYFSLFYYSFVSIFLSLSFNLFSLNL